jgi:hypothetical protein
MLAAGAGERRTRTWMVGGAAVLTVATAAFAATGGSVQPVVDTGGGWFVRPLRPREGQRTELNGAVDSSQQRDPVLPELLDLLGEIAVFLLGALLLVLVARFVWRWLDRTRPDRARSTAAPSSAEAPPVAAPALARAIDEGLARLDDGATDDAVIECWVRLEVAAAGAGLGRRPAETPSELTVRVLQGAAVPSAAIERLLGLYRTARYSSHPLPASARHDAEMALHEIRAGLEVTWP